MRCVNVVGSICTFRFIRTTLHPRTTCVKLNRMRIVCLSDTHNKHDRLRVPDADVLVHSGDFTMNGEPGELNAFALWLRGLPHKHKIIVPGNHDLGLDDRYPGPHTRMNPYRVFPDSNMHYLMDDSVTIDGVRFYGNPWVPNLDDWAFFEGRYPEWKAIPDCDVLVTHAPARGTLDEVPHTLGEHWGRARISEHVGSLRLRNAIPESVKLHIHGHIHEAYGEMVIRSGETIHRHVVNASICTRTYKPTNQPIVVDL